MKNVLTLIVLLCGLSNLLQAQCPTPPNLSATPSPVTINCTQPVVILTAASATPGVTFAWSGPNGFMHQGASPTVNAQGVYTVVATEPQNGCTTAMTVTVIGDAILPTVNILPPVYACNSGTATVTATTNSPGNIWFWSNGQQTPSIFVGQTGLYVVTVSAPNGCSATSSVQVNIDPNAPLPTATVPANLNLSCTAPSITVPITTVPAGCQIQYQGAIITNGQLVVTAPGTYTMNLFDPASGCNAPFSFTVTGTGSPSAFILPDTLTCSDPIGELTAVANFAGAQYLWSTGASLPTITVTTTGDYTVTVTDPISNCSAVATTNVFTDLNAVSFTTLVVLCPGDLGGIEVDVSAGTTVLWDNGSTNPKLDFIPAGQYCVTVTNAGLGCTASTCIDLIDPLPMNVNITGSGINCAQSVGFAVAVATGGTAPYSYTWSNGINSGPTIANLAPGTYTVTVTDVNGCTATNFITINGAFDATVLISTNGCATSASINVNATGPFTYLWNNGNTGPGATNLVGGTYIVTVTDVFGCIDIVTFNVAPNNCPQILQGQLRRDANANCLPDATESLLGNWIIRAVNTATQADFYGITDAQGFYQIGLPIGTYAVDAISLSPIWQPCPAQQVVFSAPDTITLHLAAQAIFDCPLLDVNLSAGLIRRCFQGFYSVDYCNLGTTDALEAYVDVVLDPFLTYTSSTIPGVFIATNTYRFWLDTIAVGSCGNFGITVNVSCNATLGQSHCSEAHIYPDTLCLPLPANWSGATVAAGAQCATDSVRFTIGNTGSATMTNALDYIVIEDGILRQSGNSAALTPGGTMTVTVPANGSTWRLEATQEANHPVLPDAIVNVEGCAPANLPFSTGFIAQFVLPDSMPWLDIDCTPNTGAYDPNDKSGMPVGYGTLHHVEPDTRIDYLIRFQNTGTDTAFTVVVTDTLSALLDPCTFRVLGASHQVQTKLSGRGELEFKFNNIMLPDSNVNEAASHGFVRFSIAPRPGLPLETDVFNEASIYFDFNDAVVTNRTQHRFGRDFVIVRLFEIGDAAFATVQPNPVAHQLLVQWTDEVNYQLTVIDAAGRLVNQQRGFGAAHQLTVSDWKSGVYHIRVTSDDGRTRVAKVVKVE